MMHAVASLLEESYAALVKELWEELDRRFGLRGIRVTPIPHLSWMQAEFFDEEKLLPALDELAKAPLSLTIQTSGLGLLPGASPALFIPVVKSPALAQFQHTIWQHLQDTADGICRHYHPDEWVPHISLAVHDLHEGNLGQAVQWLIQQNLNWEMPVNNLAYIVEIPDQDSVLRYQKHF